MADEIFNAIEKGMEGKGFILDGNAAVEFMTSLMNPNGYAITKAHVEDTRRRATEIAKRDMGYTS